ncbi:hypothetical protein BH20VER3_BH20VER3_07130 [soil metagenome]
MCRAGACGSSFSRSGDRATVDRESVALLRENAPDHYLLPRLQVVVARAYAVLGDADRALTNLSAAIDAPTAVTPTPALLRIDPIWDGIRNRETAVKPIFRRDPSG